MTKAMPAVFVLGLACLFALSTALPSMLSQTMSAQTESNAPRTLLGKPYRRRWDLQGCSPSRWTLAVADHNDSLTNADINAHEAQAGDDGWTQTKMNMAPPVQLPLPIILNTFPDSRPARLRLIRSKRPLLCSLCSDDAPPFNQARSDGPSPENKDEQHVRSPVIFRTERETGSREVSNPTQRSKRMYDKGEWKSRLLEEY